jgi:hypothetical protein
MTIARLRRPRRAAVGAAAVAVAVLTALVGATGLRPASAAQLAITATAQGSGGGTATSRACAASELVLVPNTTTANVTTVSVTGMTAAELAACSGKPYVVQVVDSNGNPLASWSGAMSGTQLVLTGQGFWPGNAFATLVQVDGWVLPSSWRAQVSCLVPDFPDDSCTAVIQIFSQYTSGGVMYAQGKTWVSIQSADPTRRVVVTFDVRKYTGFTPTTWAVNDPSFVTFVDVGDGLVEMTYRSATQGDTGFTASGPA